MQFIIYVFISGLVYLFFLFSTLLAYCIFPIFVFFIRELLVFFIDFFFYDLSPDNVTVVSIKIIYTFAPGTVKPIKFGASDISGGVINRDEIYFIRAFAENVLRVAKLRGYSVRDSYLYILFSQYNLGNEERLYDILIRMFVNSRPVYQEAFHKRWVAYADAGIRDGPIFKMLVRFEEFFNFIYRLNYTNGSLEFNMGSAFFEPLEWLCDYYNALLDLYVFLADFQNTVADRLKSIDGHGKTPDYWKLKPWVELVWELKLEVEELFDKGAVIYGKLDPTDPPSQEIIPYFLLLNFLWFFNFLI